MPDPSPGSSGAWRADQQRREKRADEVDAIGRGVRRRFALRELSDLRGGEALERARPGALRQRAIAADRRLDFARTRPTCSSPSRSARRGATSIGLTCSASGRAGIEPASALRRARR